MTGRCRPHNLPKGSISLSRNEGACGENRLDAIYSSSKSSQQRMTVLYVSLVWWRIFSVGILNSFIVEMNGLTAAL